MPGSPGCRQGGRGRGEEGRQAHRNRIYQVLKSFAAYSLSATIKKEATAAGERGLLPSPLPTPALQSVSHAVLVSLSRHWLNLCGPKSFCTLSTRKELFRIKFAVMAAPVTHQVSSCRPLVCYCCCYCSADVVVPVVVGICF